MEYQIAKYDARDGDYLGVCLNSKGQPWTYPTREAAQAAAAWFNTLGFSDTKYEACQHHREAELVLKERRARRA